jgi:predicted DNA repair protein MutK
LWAITKGSFLNKLIIVPLTLLLNIFFPTAIIAILILGGFYLAFEGVEKIKEYLFNRNEQNQQTELGAVKQDNELEKVKIKSAITTDFILSIEIVIISLSTVLDKSLFVQLLTLSIVSILLLSLIQSTITNVTSLILFPVSGGISILLKFAS